MDEARVTPFHCGSQGGDWVEKNCNNCHWGFVDNPGSEPHGYHCDIQMAIDAAYMNDGTVSELIGVRMGAVSGGYGWRCPELKCLEPIEEYAKRFEPRPTKLMPLWRRISHALRLAWKTWTPRWSTSFEPDDPWCCIPLRTTLTIGWGIWRDARVPDRRRKR